MRCAGESWRDALSTSQTYQPSPRNIGQIAAPGSGSLLNEICTSESAADGAGLDGSRQESPCARRAQIQLTPCTKRILRKRIRNFVVTFRVIFLFEQLHIGGSAIIYRAHTPPQGALRIATYRRPCELYLAGDGLPYRDCRQCRRMTQSIWLAELDKALHSHRSSHRSCPSTTNAVLLVQLTTFSATTFRNYFTMPRAEGKHSKCIPYKLLNSPYCSRYAQVCREQDEVKGTSASPMVLSSVREAMPRRERLQVPRRIRVASAADARSRRACGKPHRRLFAAVPVRIRHLTLAKVRSFSFNIVIAFSRYLICCPQIWNETCTS